MARRPTYEDLKDLVSELEDARNARLSEVSLKDRQTMAESYYRTGQAAKQLGVCHRSSENVVF